MEENDLVPHLLSEQREKSADFEPYEHYVVFPAACPWKRMEKKRKIKNQNHKK